MLIRIFRSGYIIKIFMFLVVSLLLWLPAFLSPPQPVASTTFGIAYDFLADFFIFSDTINVLVAFVLLLLQAIVFNAVLVENPLFSKSVFLPALIYVILMSHNPANLILHPALIANFFLIFSLKNLYSTYEKKEALREAFNASFWVALASLFYLPAIYMMVLIWSAFLIFRINTWREWMISIIGVSTPYLILIAFFYLTDRMSFLRAYYPGNLSWIWANFTVRFSDYIFWPAFLILILVAYFKFSTERVDKIISVRKGFAVVNAFLVIAAISILFSGPDPHQHAYLLFPASSVIIAYYFIEMRKMIWPELLFLLLLASIVVVKFI
jgi:hypothetical protein